MARVVVFNMQSIDGCFSSLNGDMSWAHAEDDEWQDFTRNNARGGGLLLFGRVTYDMMAAWWPSLAALDAFPVVAERMNGLPKVVFSRTMDRAEWSNTTLVKTDPAAEVRRLKKGSRDMAVMGSGTIVSLLAEEGLVDEFQIVVIPLILGGGKSMFERVQAKHPLRLVGTRSFQNGNVLLRYEPAGG